MGTRSELLKLFPGRSWFSIEGKGRGLGLKRPQRTLISATLYRMGDVGFSAGMVIADAVS